MLYFVLYVYNVNWKINSLALSLSYSLHTLEAVNQFIVVEDLKHFKICVWAYQCTV